MADDTYNADDLTVVEAMFVRDAEDLASHFLPADVDVEKLYLLEFPLEGRFKPSARDAFIDRFNAGSLLLVYIGHGNAQVFAHEHHHGRALAQGQFYRLGSGAGIASGAAPEGLTWGAPYGLMTPAQECALHTRRWMHDHGVSQEALASVSLACYANAQRNPRAVRYGRPLTREAYHASRWIVEPFHLYDCCPENDGGPSTPSMHSADFPTISRILRKSPAIASHYSRVGEKNSQPRIGGTRIIR